MTEPVVKSIMSSELVTLHKKEDLELAGTLMHLARIRHLPVVDDHDELVGLVTHRDLLKAQGDVIVHALEGKGKATTINAESIMIREVRTVSPDTPILEAGKLIHDFKYGCLPVVESGRLVGIVTEADFVSWVINSLEAGKIKASE